MAETMTKKPAKIPPAIPNVGGQGHTATALAIESALVQAVGARVRITNSHSRAFEGTVFAVDPVRRLVALNTTPPPPTPSSSAPTKDTPSDYHIFHISRLLKVDVLSPAPSTPENTPKQVNPAAGEDRLRKAVLAEKKKEERVGKGVTKEAQVVFDGILRTGLPTRWVGKDIMVMDSVLVTSPYGSQNCKSVDKNNQALARVKKVLENEKQKRSSALRKGENASSPKGDARKGG